MPSYNPAMRTPTILLGAMLLCAATSSLAQTAEGDQQWALRAEGHQGGHAKAARVDAAITAYQKAVAASPSDLEARYKLLRALRFKAAYATSSADEKKKLYTQAKKAGEEALTVVDRQ
ncbi:MAG: hypothetical protein JWN02_1142, partial [Acidobacteria bacterium]|nr:hypothetical protein [Acidobacteriota bacterium]